MGCAEEAVRRRTVGMFAFALWDKRERTLTLVRDRVGIKPLYWGRVGQMIVFGSELKALARAPGFAPRTGCRPRWPPISGSAMCRPHRLSIGGCPSSGRGIFSPWARTGRSPIVVTGIFATIAAAGSRLADPAWSVTQATEALEGPAGRGGHGARLVSDVPLGAFLSGGIDSTAVVALMQGAIGSMPVKTFTVGFEDAGLQRSAHMPARWRRNGSAPTIRN